MGKDCSLVIECGKALFPIAGLLDLISGPYSDPSASVRHTAAYALWTAVQNGDLRGALCEHDRALEVLRAVAMALLGDSSATVASQAAALLAELLEDVEICEEGSDIARWAWRLVPDVVRRCSEPFDTPRPAERDDLRDSCDSLLSILVPLCSVDSELLRLLEVRP